MREAMCGIYSIEDRSGRIYVGSSSDIRKRWDQHRKSLVKGKHHNYKLQAAWKEHDPDFFAWKILQCVEDDAELLKFEQYWIDLLGPWYNVALEANRPVASDPKKAMREQKRLDKELALEVALQDRMKSAEKRVSQAQCAMLRAFGEIPSEDDHQLWNRLRSAELRARRGLDPWNILSQHVFQDARTPIIRLGENALVDSILELCDNRPQRDK